MVTASVTSSIDTDKLLDRCMGNSELLAKLMTAFSKTLPVERNLLQAAIQSNDLTVVARIAHKLKGTASNMCAQSLSEIANDMEQSARLNQLDSINGQWEKIASQIDSVIDCIAAKGSTR